MLAGGAASALLAAAGPALSAGCLSERGANPNGWRVFRATNPPLSNAVATISNFASWPCTDAVSSDWDSTTSTWSGGGPLNNWPINAWFYVWANRAASPSQATLPPNPLQSPAITHPGSGYECRVNYTSIAKANAATQCLVRYWLGRSDYMQPWLRIGGTSPGDFVTYKQLQQNPAAYFTATFKVANAHENVIYATMTDRPWLPSAPVSKANPNGLYQRAFMMPAQSPYQNAPGLVLDYEVQDGRSTGVGASAGDPNGSLNFIKALHADTHAVADSNGKQQAPARLALFTNPLNAPTMPQSGLDASNLYKICQNYADLISIQLFGGAQEGSFSASYADQIALLKAGAVKSGGSGAIPYGKLILTFDVSGARAADAVFAHNLLQQGATTSPPTAPQAVWFWNDGASDCATATNAQITTVLQGPGPQLASLP